jgi:hypothetical protein
MYTRVFQYTHHSASGGIKILQKYIVSPVNSLGEVNSLLDYHNDVFSACSKDNMTRVMQAVFEGKYGKINCFRGMYED